MKHAVLVAFILAAFTLARDGGEDPAGTPANSWPMLAHNPRSSFFNANETSLSTSNAPLLTESWEITTSGSVTGAPAVVDGRVYVLAGGGLYALNAIDGSVIWQNDDVRGTSSPTFHNGKLYVNTSRAGLLRVDAATGEQDWAARIDPHPNATGFSSPVVAGDLVVVGSASVEEVSAREGATFRGSLVALERATGREVWRHYTADPPHNGVAIWSSPSIDVDEGLVFGSTGNNYTGDAGPSSDSIFALDLATGALRWNRQLSQGDVFTIPSPRSEDSDFGTNPVIFDAEIDGSRRKLVGAGQKSGMFWVLDRLTGEIVWSRRASDGSAIIGGVFNNGAFDGERIIIAGNNGTSAGPGSETANGRSRILGGASVATSVLMALDPATGAVMWERQLPAWVWAPITIANGVGFVSADNEIQAFDVATGAILFRMQTGGTIASGATIVDGRVYFGNGLGYIGTTHDDAFHALGVPNP